MRAIFLATSYALLISIVILRSATGNDAKIYNLLAKFYF